MAQRQMIEIDEGKCNGCGECIPNCPEGALQIIDGKARLISDLFCDGLGACIGHCPQGAIATLTREAQGYDEKRVMENIVKQGQNVIKAHLEHLKNHGQEGYLKQALDFLKKCPSATDKALGCPSVESASGGCPGSKMMDFRAKDNDVPQRRTNHQSASALKQWPVQIMLVPAHAPFFENAEVLIAADCVPFAYADFHEDLLKGKVLLVGCPKLDELNVYGAKFSEILEQHAIKSITYAHMEVPCCFGMINVIKSAIAASGKKVPFEEVTISIKGERLR
ncbi:MAG: 4Fe-4S binding protein [Candidatus Omnitrophota bacterium]|jgi:ferredoxin